MTTLYERLLGQANNIPVDNYASACGQQKRGKMTRQEIIDAWSLTGDQANDHDDIIDRMNDVLFPLGQIEIRDTLLLNEGEQKVHTEASLKSAWGIS